MMDNINITCECGRDHKEITERVDTYGDSVWIVGPMCTTCLEEYVTYVVPTALAGRE